MPPPPPPLPPLLLPLLLLLGGTAPGLVGVANQADVVNQAH
eukprot:gene6327-6814_t